MKRNNNLPHTFSDNQYKRGEHTGTKSLSALLFFPLFYYKAKVTKDKNIKDNKNLKHLHILILFLLLLPIASSAQKKEIAEAKTYLKQGKNLDKAESLVRKVIAMPGQEASLDNHVLLTDIMRKRYEGVNELLYLKQLKDTTQLFTVLHGMFLAYEALDTIDAQPDSKGNVKIKHRRKNAEYLNMFRPNLFQAGMYYIRHRDMNNAYLFMHTYLDCHKQPLFTGMNYSQNDSLANEAAFWAVFAARRLKNYENVNKYGQWALKYQPSAHRTIAMLYENSIENNDTVTAVAYLRKGFNEHPEHHYFFPRLVDYYVSVNQFNTVCEIVDKACELEPGNQFYRLARNTIQLNMGEYDKCIELGDSLIHHNDKMSEAYMNVGSSYFNKALQKDKQTVGLNRKEIRNKREEVNAYYEKALPYIETYRKQRPKRSDRWAPMLYTIYLNLNMGEKFEEIDNLLKKGQ